ncbi:ATPase, T2SS/T4P/T4SS family [Agarilytica rhodophyticola]|uniref:ATPase, T2SS/T4P/T4SS family n=1 Tax=Agarilytica rhodophyticola TaxID=1737490 RepID=UPI000B346C20|nr:ATPase, T2SS/T4P/T4SS family [Agarilytica rhodophyticola]
MYRVDVNTKSGTKVSSFTWSEEECQIGRSKSNHIVLHGWRVSGVHAIIRNMSEGAFISASVDSRNIVVNKKKFAEYGPIQESDIIQIGDYVIRLKPKGDQKEVAFQSGAGDKKTTNTNQTSSTDNTQVNNSTQQQEDHAGSIDDSLKMQSHEWRSKIHRQLFQIMDLRRVNISEMDDVELREFTRNTIDEILKDLNDFPDTLDAKQLGYEVLAEAVGLGPLEDLLNNEQVSEVMVNACDEIFYEEAGQLKKSKITFTNDRSVIGAIERIVAPLGRRIDESSPMVDARLKDGSRVNAIIPPLALKGPSITIRKFMKNRLTSDDLIRFGSANSDMVKFLETAIVRKRNVVISGGTGSGKTTLLNILSNYIPDNERIVTVEDAAELKLYQPNLVSLEARPPNQEGKGAIHIRDLVKNCLRMRPDRIVVGECRGGEALDMLQAMNTGHDGSLTTIHSNSPRDCISRMEVLVLMSGMDLPVRAIREQISSAVNIIVQQTRFSCGSRRVTSVTEVTGVEGDTVQLSEIFRFRQTGYDSNGKIEGRFESTGLVPEFYEDLRRRGIEVDMSIFREEHNS